MAQDPLSPGLLPADAARADLVLAVADGAPRNPLARQRRHPVRAVADLARHLLWNRLGLAFGVLFAILLVGFVLLAAEPRFSLANAAYLTGMDVAGAAVSKPGYPPLEKIAQLLLTFDGLAFLPVLTAVVVSARLTGSVRRAGA